MAWCDGEVGGMRGVVWSGGRLHGGKKPEEDELGYERFGEGLEDMAIGARET